MRGHEPIESRAGGQAEQVRIVVHDYSGHPFQVQLSRELRPRGHDVLHLHCSSFTSRRGAVQPRRPDDPTPSRSSRSTLGEPFEKYYPGRRLRQERRYGRLVAARLARSGPTSCCRATRRSSPSRS